MDTGTEGLTYKGGLPEEKVIHVTQLNMVEDCMVACSTLANTLVYFDLQGCQASFCFC